MDKTSEILDLVSESKYNRLHWGEGSLFILLGVGGGERHTGPWAKPWFLEDPVSGSLPCFVSALGRALDNSAGA